jgi:hypothetical protein
MKRELAFRFNTGGKDYTLSLVLCLKRGIVWIRRV